MDKKLRKKLCDFLQCDCGETHCASIDYLEQAFRDAHWIEPQQPEGLNKEKLPLEVYNRFEWFWYEPEVTEILDDLYSGESEAVSKLTDRILALNGEGWRVAIITKPKPEPQQPDKSLEREIIDVLCEFKRNESGQDLCREITKCSGVTCSKVGEPAAQILALLQPQQPAIDIVALSWARCNCGHSMMTHRDGDGCCDRSMCNCKKFEPQQPETEQKICGLVLSDNLLDKFEIRMEQELSLNSTQTAHARQILSDLMDILEPQQPEELVKSDIYRHSCITPYPALVMAKCHACVWDEATLAQHTLDLKTMVKLPSEDELALWLCDHLSYTSRGLAQVLLERLLPL